MKKFDIFTLVCQGIVLILCLIVGFSIKGEKEVPQIKTSVKTVITSVAPPPPIIPKPLPTPVQKRPYEYDASLSLKQKEKIIDECNEYVNYLNGFYWDVYKDEVVLETEEVIELYLEDINIWKEKAKEYPTAARVWRWATEEMGYSEQVAAGIIGNMMVEVGGHTLALRERTRVGKYYGLCMWQLPYSSGVNGQNLIEQLNFLARTMEKNMGSSNYRNLLKSKNAREASIIFAKYYERCVSPYGRQDEAMRAYRYFTK